MPRNTLIQYRRDTAANWLSVNPVLASGEPALETDTNKYKIGDGTRTWSLLPYQGSGSGVPDGGTTGQVLAKVSSTNGDVAWVDANGATTQLKKYVMNKTGSTIPAGSAVYISGADGNNALIALSRANAEATSSKTLGLTETSIANNAKGYVVMEGSLSGINTSSADEGDAVWLSPDVAGGLVFWHYGGSTTKPSAPNHLVYLGIVVKKSAGNGVLEVRVQNGFEIEELHNVAISGPTDGQGIIYDATLGYWKNGDVGSSAAASFSGTYSGTTWNVAHNLGFRPSVTTMDNALTPNQVEGEVQYTDANNLTVTFTTTVTGTIYLS